jgi:hypothetical protein
VASLARAEEATELRVRLELPERAQSTLEELSEERRRREEVERESDRLRNRWGRPGAAQEPPAGRAAGGCQALLVVAGGAAIVFRVIVL